jgi:hypothetical protein
MAVFWGRDQLLVVSCQLPVASCQLSVASCQLSVVSCQLSVASDHSPVASCRRPRTTDHGPPAAHHSTPPRPNAEIRVGHTQVVAGQGKLLESRLQAVPGPAEAGTPTLGLPRATFPSPQRGEGARRAGEGATPAAAKHSLPSPRRGGPPSANTHVWGEATGNAVRRAGESAGTINHSRRASGCVRTGHRGFEGGAVSTRPAWKPGIGLAFAGG